MDDPFGDGDDDWADFVAPATAADSQQNEKVINSVDQIPIAASTKGSGVFPYVNNEDDWDEFSGFEGTLTEQSTQQSTDLKAENVVEEPELHTLKKSDEVASAFPIKFPEPSVANSSVSVVDDPFAEIANDSFPSQTNELISDSCSSVPTVESSNKEELPLIDDTVIESSVPMNGSTQQEDDVTLPIISLNPITEVNDVTVLGTIETIPAEILTPIPAANNSNSNHPAAENIDVQIITGNSGSVVNTISDTTVSTEGAERTLHTVNGTTVTREGAESTALAISPVLTMSANPSRDGHDREQEEQQQHDNNNNNNDDPFAGLQLQETATTVESTATAISNIELVPSDNNKRCDSDGDTNDGDAVTIEESADDRGILIDNHGAVSSIASTVDMIVPTDSTIVEDDPFAFADEEISQRTKEEQAITTNIDYHDSNNSNNDAIIDYTATITLSEPSPADTIISTNNMTEETAETLIATDPESSTLQSPAEIAETSTVDIPPVADTTSSLKENNGNDVEEWDGSEAILADTSVVQQIPATITVDPIIADDLLVIDATTASHNNQTTSADAEAFTADDDDDDDDWDGFVGPNDHAMKEHGNDNIVIADPVASSSDHKQVIETEKEATAAVIETEDDDWDTFAGPVTHQSTASNEPFSSSIPIVESKTEDQVEAVNNANREDEDEDWDGFVEPVSAPAIISNGTANNEGSQGLGDNIVSTVSNASNNNTEGDEDEDDWDTFESANDPSPAVTSSTVPATAGSSALTHQPIPTMTSSASSVPTTVPANIANNAYTNSNNSEVIFALLSKSLTSSQQPVIAQQIATFQSFSSILYPSKTLQLTRSSLNSVAEFPISVTLPTSLSPALNATESSVADPLQSHSQSSGSSSSSLREEGLQLLAQYPVPAHAIVTLAELEVQLERLQMSLYGESPHKRLAMPSSSIDERDSPPKLQRQRQKRTPGIDLAKDK
jgi:hypothetical protein